MKPKRIGQERLEQLRRMSEQTHADILPDCVEALYREKEELEQTIGAFKYEQRIGSAKNRKFALYTVASLAVAEAMTHVAEHAANHDLPDKPLLVAAAAVTGISVVRGWWNGARNTLNIAAATVDAAIVREYYEVAEQRNAQLQLEQG